MLLFPVLLTQMVFAAMSYSVHEQSIREHRAKQSSKTSLLKTNYVKNVTDTATSTRQMLRNVRWIPI